VLEDGGAPPSRVDVLCACNGSVYVSTHTNRGGEFAFRVGISSNRGLQDASVGQSDGAFGRSRAGPPPLQDPSAVGGSQQPVSDSRNSSTRVSANDQLLKNCELQVMLPGYRSESISLATRRPSDSPDLGTIVLNRVTAGEDPSVSITWLAAPKEARREFDKGRAALRNQKPDEARQHLEKAARIYPRYAAAWCELGGVQAAQQRAGEARQSFAAAIQADPKYIDPYLRLSVLQAAERQWQQLAETSGQALRLDPARHPQAYFLNALANFNLGDLDTAEKNAREAERIDTRRQFPRAWRLLAAILTARREYGEAAGQLREYLKLAPLAADADLVRTELAKLEKLAGGSGHRP
jgi:tetratricopeptide (TPR) repeat protein